MKHPTAPTPGLHCLACTDAWLEATLGLEQLVVYITQKQYMRMGAHIHLFKQSTPKNDFFRKMRKPFFPIPMRALDMQYQVCNSKTVDFGFHRQTEGQTEGQTDN